MKSQPAPTPVFEAYWRFAAERHRIWEARRQGLPAPWTADPVLTRYKFCNAFRCLDRVSQFCIGEVIAKGSQTPEEIFFRVMLFKLFNHIDTWDLLKVTCGDVPSWKDFDALAYAVPLKAALKKGKTIFGGAYRLNQKYRVDLEWKHERYLALLQFAMEQGTVFKLLNAKTYEQAYWVMRELPLHGSFVAMQHVCDLNYTELLPFDEDDFIECGPGCLNGIQKCLGIELKSTNRTDMRLAAAIIKYCVDNQENYFAAIGEKPVTLGGRRLKLVDLQNCMCEVDKMARISHPEYNLDESEMKRGYDPAAARALPPMTLPAKWGLSIAE